MARNGIEFLVAYFACSKAGLICSPVNLAMRSEEIGYCLKDSKARALIIESVLTPAIDSLPLRDAQQQRHPRSGDRRDADSGENL